MGYLPRVSTMKGYQDHPALLAVCCGRGSSAMPLPTTGVGQCSAIPIRASGEKGASGASGMVLPYSIPALEPVQQQGKPCAASAWPQQLESTVLHQTVHLAGGQVG